MADGDSAVAGRPLFRTDSYCRELVATVIGYLIAEETPGNYKEYVL